ncbi:Mandelate racemase/muconate lactonizing protein [Fibrella aestuarina BUZ 2]|uniref:o-succinylbenzoate synthase n=1 Tax=Fibrella aestuarina BUZ 2 TaxID=1166018 RepID=I0KB13_9BACT|nr:o-succinylbenzoate synthase [Fibrella aestuarina]CCH01316.1 Mandelate racemase/muconate lactonizing protein [Fibrella aestuarina BUZ 2]
MSLQVSYLKYTLHFTFEAGTSRGTLTQKDSYFLRLVDTDQPDVVGYGECGPLKGLSLDDQPDFEARLADYCSYFNQLDLQLFDWNVPIVLNQLISQQYPSILFGFETAMHDFLSGGKRFIRENEFVHGRRAIPINGLVWMGSHEAMRAQIDQKLAAGYTTIKLKIGAIDFDQECALLGYIRERYSPEQITLRVDANGAFRPDEAMTKLERLAQYGLHSIEQPIKPGQHELMAELCRHTPVPIALDEELIGHMEYVDKFRLLKKIQPQYVILKPTLLGGLRHCDEWIELANRLSIGWWITSALESNIGLNAIAQYAAQFKNLMPQGLGTGQLYHNNIDSPLRIDHGTLRYDPAVSWHLNGISL